MGLMLAGAGLLVDACGGDSPSTLDTHGPAAARISGLWWLMLTISAIVFVVVLGFLVMAMRRARRRDADPRREARWGEPVIVVGGVIVPAIVLTAVFIVTLRDMSALSAPQANAPMTITVTGHDWWWEASYTNPIAVTANEIHIPVGEPVALRLRSADVIHSFWVPELQAKTDMVPGRSNEMWLEADDPGRYRGQCAEFCGLQHAQMAFYVVAQPKDIFAAWLRRQARPAPSPPTAGARAGEGVFMTSTCAGCHTVRGSGVVSEVGPDLTHLASRATIAAGTLTNTRSNLARWIQDPQGVKPGTVMPPTQLTPQQLHDLLDYLEGLR